MDAFISGAWRTIRRADVTIGGATRLITRAEIYRSGGWQSAVRFTSALSVTAYDVSGFANGRGRPTLVVSNASQATPTGGLAPYSYSWSILSGGAAAQTAASASTVFRQTIGPNVTEDSLARVTCTDALGSSAFHDINITLSNESNL